MYRVFKLSVAIAALAGLTVCARADDSKTPSGDDKNKSVKRPPLVIMNETEVIGRVFILADGKHEEAVASGIPVQILDKGNKKSICETKTDKTGSYLIPKLSVGEYSMIIGRLHLRLTVVARKTEGNEEEASKIILVFLPKELR